jgi:CRP-like cAMP-binding protein
MAKAAKPPPPRNKILAALPIKEYGRLFTHLTPVSLRSGETLYETEARIKYVYFINGAVVSLVTHMEEGASVEVGLVGNEGMVGLSVVMGDSVSQNHAIVQIPDGAMRMGAGALRAAAALFANTAQAGVADSRLQPQSQPGRKARALAAVVPRPSRRR